ncbi:MAG: lipocalin family protein [Candidatus Marinimicrobia bacterium]|nr:lipocalin family protein [Candidatus Neomarinimicrobiota bacterium]
MKMKYFFLVLLGIFLLSCDNEEADLNTVKSLDISKFMGDWYVLAVIPNFIEEGATNGIESYALDNKGNVNIEYTFRKNGKTKTMKARGFVQDGTNAFWKVQFLWPVKLPYLVIDLDENYQYTVIGVPNRKFVWIMAREPQIDEYIYQNILNKLEKTGYDVKLIKPMQQTW